MLTVDHVGKTYSTRGKHFEAVADFTFEIGAGEFFTIVGPSGAGKTTALRCLSGLMPVSKGTISFEGRAIDGPPPEFAVVFQDYARSLLPWYSVSTNVELPLRAAKVPLAERRKRVEESLHAVGLGNDGHKHPWELSGGMQQRVAIARAIAYRPRLLIMDEPFASVDAQTRADLEDLLIRVKEETGMSVLFVTHDVDESVYLSDRVAIVTRSPSRISEIVDINLPGPRDQVKTKELAEFAHLRGHVFRRIRSMVQNTEL